GACLFCMKSWGLVPAPHTSDGVMFACKPTGGKGQKIVISLSYTVSFKPV
ncbi:mCG1047760, partial [Mus musculus]